MNYSASADIYGIILPSYLYGGASPWGLYAFVLVANASFTDQALWFSHFTSGSFSASVTIPAGGTSYCLGWWEPSLSPASVQWHDDLNVTYQ